MKFKENKIIEGKFIYNFGVKKFFIMRYMLKSNKGRLVILVILVIKFLQWKKNYTVIKEIGGRDYFQLFVLYIKYQNLKYECIFCVKLMRKLFDIKIKVDE